jgi:hypothetical protein
LAAAEISFAIKNHGVASAARHIKSEAMGMHMEQNLEHVPTAKAYCEGQ